MKEFEQENSTTNEGEVTMRSSKDYAMAQANKELDKIKRKQRAMNRLDFLKKQKEQAVVKLQQLQEVQKKDFGKKERAMNKVWDKYCQDFNQEDFDKAQSMWAKLKEEGDDLEPLQFNTKE